MKSVKSLYKLSLVICLFISINQIVWAEPQNVFINEIFPAPSPSPSLTPSDYDSEWVEIYNPDRKDLKNWKIYDKHKYKDKDSDASGSAIIEISENSTDKYIKLLNNGSRLNNKNETVYLEDDQGSLIDEVSYSHTVQNKSLQRFPDGGEWQKDKNEKMFFLEETLGQKNIEVDQVEPSASPMSSPDTNQTTIDNINISELYPSPNNGDKEWVELYNNNDYEVKIKNWYLYDDTHKQNLGDLIIPSHNYSSVHFNSGFLNNDGENIQLKSVDDQIKDQLPQVYPKIGKGLSWAKVDNKWCVAQPSENNDNTCYISPTPTPSATPMQSSTLDNSIDSKDYNDSLKILNNSSISADRKLPEFIIESSQGSVAGVATNSATSISKKKVPIFIFVVVIIGLSLMVYVIWGSKINLILQKLPWFT